MAFENLKKSGIQYLLTKLKEHFLQIKDAVVSVNGETADEYGNIRINEVPFAQNLVSEVSRTNSGEFIQRTTGGEASIESGSAWLMKIYGNSIREGYVPESLELTVTPMPREEGVESISATIDRNTFVAFVNTSGTYTLTYSTAWSADPSLYGVTVTGEPIAGDVITIVYVAEIRGTINSATPSRFYSTGWNLYRHSSTGYARVIKYSDTYGFKIDGTYTALEYSDSLTGSRTEITPVNGNFTIPADGYIFVTGGNATDTAIWMTWADWTEEPNQGEYEGYTSTYVDLYTVMQEYFPEGLLSIEGTRDEIDLNIGAAISRIEVMEYTTENLAEIISSGRAYTYDNNYIFAVRTTPITYNISVDGSYTASDHGIEFFDETDVPVLAEILYGNNLKNKLERDVVTLSQQTLTTAQKEQVRTNIDAASQADVTSLSNKIAKNKSTIMYSSDFASLSAFTTAMDALIPEDGVCFIPLGYINYNPAISVGLIHSGFLFGIGRSSVYKAIIVVNSNTTGAPVFSILNKSSGTWGTEWKVVNKA